MEDDLLAAPVCMILGASKLGFVSMRDVKRCLVIALKMGISYKPLAIVGIDALDFYLEHDGDAIRHF